jgi:imidazolonepropionase-like amidohydrolase
MKFARPACLLLSLCGSLAAAHASNIEAQTEHYSVLISGAKVGHLDATVDGRKVSIDFDYKNNGRGPTLKEKIALSEAGLPSSWEVDGNTTFGSKVSESFKVDEGQAHWKDAAGAGSAAADGQHLYAAQSASPWALGLYARALLADGQSSMAAYPAGAITLEEGESVLLGEQGSLLNARAYAVGGLDLNPRYLLLDEQRQMVAFITPRLVLVRKGYEAEEQRLRGLAAQLSTQRMEKLQQETAKVFDAPVRIRNVRVFDPHTLALSPLSSVVFRGHKISSVQPADSPDTPGEVQIDGQGGTLIAGMFEMHGHLSQEQGPLNLAAGITSVRDMGNANEVLDGLIERVERGEIAGTRVFRSGFIEGKSPFSSNNGILVESQDAAIAAVRWYAARGYWQVKLYNSMTPAWAPAIVAEAHRLGLRVAGHVPAFGNADGMLDAGYDELTHINQIMLGWVLKADEDTRSLLRFTAMKRFVNLDLESDTVQATLKRMTSRGVAVEPTIAIHEAGMLGRDGQIPVGQASYLQHMPIGYQRDARQAWFAIDSADDDRQYRAAFAKIMDTLRLMHQRGVLLVPGTDLGGSFAYHRELELFQQLGLSPAQVLRRATWDMAKHLGTEQSLGSIEARKLADFFIVDGDPTQDLGVLKQVRLVVKDGAVYAPSEIHARYGVRKFAEPLVLPEG